jgi:uncharacterized membrane protein
MTAQEQRAVQERRMVEIAYALLTGLAMVAVPALAGRLLGWTGYPLYQPVVTVLGALAMLRAVVILVRFEARLRDERRDGGSSASGDRPRD